MSNKDMKRHNIDRGICPNELQFQKTFVDFLNKIDCDSYGYASDKHNLRDNNRGGIVTDLFTIRPFYWGSNKDEQLKPNFEYHGKEYIDIEWYKYPLRGSTSNIELSYEKLCEILQDCLTYYNSINSIHSDKEEINRCEDEKMLQVAINFAKEKHKFQLDKADEPYINHLMWVMDDMDSNVEKIVAILHDIVEDTDVEFEDLIKLGFSDEIVEAIKAITKAKGQDYDEYLEQVKKNDIARKVKLSDLYHNMDLRRLKEITELDLKRKEKYEKAFECLIKK
jgi:hypothetical protein